MIEAFTLRPRDIWMLFAKHGRRPGKFRAHYEDRSCAIGILSLDRFGELRNSGYSRLGQELGLTRGQTEAVANGWDSGMCGSLFDPCLVNEDDRRLYATAYAAARTARMQGGSGA